MVVNIYKNWLFDLVSFFFVDVLGVVVVEVYLYVLMLRLSNEYFWEKR